MDAVRTRGKVALIAESNKATIDPSNQFLRKRTELIGCWYFNRADWEEIANFIVSNNIEMKKFVVRLFLFQKLRRHFRFFDSGATQKVVFVWE